MGKQVTAVDESTRNTVKGFHTHAAGCKRNPDECIRCQLAINYFATLPLPVLAEVLSETPAR